ncbi:MAG: bifunctional 4-hydroxy-2-oxoglutarate aldolase/2-dehydro-3-deoxy-phosphogluconate aldolase [Verrucomicrobiota bacterium]|jgi:2-dehydro-3-deoxyphosphogluconate aldolase/(4S)-4-hydroxy-2-oxoglutarate aldolase
MRSRSEIVTQLADPGVIAIIRTQSAAAVAPVVAALMAGGLNAIEITLTVPGALAIIRQTRAKFGDQILLGAGTVLDVPTCEAVIAAGAEYIVTPIMRPALVAAAHALGKPVALGAYTPTEAQLAHEAGADFVKIFPADGLGPNYIKNLKAPLPHLRIVPTGGVTPQNVGDWIRAGATAVGVGSALVSAQLVKEQNWSELTRVAALMVQAARTARA